MCADLISAHYNGDEDKFKEITGSIWINDFDPEIALLIKAHKEHDEDKFNIYCGVLAAGYKDPEDEMLIIEAFKRR